MPGIPRGWTSPFVAVTGCSDKYEPVWVGGNFFHRWCCRVLSLMITVYQKDKKCRVTRQRHSWWLKGKTRLYLLHDLWSCCPGLGCSGRPAVWHWFAFCSLTAFFNALCLSRSCLALCAHLSQNLEYSITEIVWALVLFVGSTSHGFLLGIRVDRLCLDSSAFLWVYILYELTALFWSSTNKTQRHGWRSFFGFARTNWRHSCARSPCRLSFSMAYYALTVAI